MKSVYGMSFSRSEALARMDSFSERINEHVIECVVYKEARKDTINHWITEIAGWLYRINKMETKSKLKESDYINHLFSEFGSDRSDAEVNLSVYQVNNDRMPDYSKYPEFEITDELIENLYLTYSRLIQNSIDILTSNYIASLDSWKDVVKESLLCQ